MLLLAVFPEFGSLQFTLGALLNGPHKGLSLAAKDALLELEGDDSRSVSETAIQILKNYMEAIVGEQLGREAAPNLGSQDEQRSVYIAANREQEEYEAAAAAKSEQEDRDAAAEPNPQRRDSFDAEREQEQRASVDDMPNAVEEAKRSRAVAPTVLNPSQEFIEKKDLRGGSPRGELWTPSRFYEDLEKRAGPSAAAQFREVAEWAEGCDNVIPYFGRGKRDGSIQIAALREPPRYRGATDVVFLTLWTYGRVEIGFQYLAMKPPFDSEDLREQLRQRLNKLPGVWIREDEIQKRPSLEWQTLAEPTNLAAFLQVLAWLVREYRNEWTNKVAKGTALAQTS